MEKPSQRLARFLTEHKPALVLTGAGLSTASGIPAYRDSSGEWIHPRPVLAAEFKHKDSVRRRYWRRSMSGWPNFNNAQPNPAHLSITHLQQAGIVSGIVTQNVDGLHQAAGATGIIELHGALRNVICLSCGQRLKRAGLQTELLDKNAEYRGEKILMGADGDATPTDSQLSDDGFQYPNCKACNGLLKPDVVFFGENVPTESVKAGSELLRQSSSLLCIGSSLSVLSGFRYCREAVKQDKPVIILNQGKTRADDIAALKVNADCANVLQELTQLLCD